ncbi:hypothetical protein SAMN05421776_101265 [Nocardia farcinica]|uniref:Uncharacterized protein n=3 Tax=Nocardiaceae TaxID=85025 RepID=A0A0H5NI50_NOCFR|nr:Uncharacterised protein [Nocardia farcinica]SIS61740.1 hypothetical protein SAMN05421776_101265 [Nocardia farcinica]VFA90902.1 Uncharacterised protein [Nocardia farcinica]
MHAMTTSDPVAPFEWLLTHDGRRCPLDEIYTVAFFRGLDPSEVVRRYSRGEDHGQEASFDELMEQAAENSSLPGRSGGGTVGVVRVGEWSVAIEPDGWMATLHDVLADLSRGCEVVAITRHDYAEASFAYAIDGTVVTGYKPLDCPHSRHGTEPDRLNGFMRELGMTVDVRDDENDGDEYDWEEEDERAESDYLASLPRAFALAAKLTHVRFTPEILDRAMVVGPVAYK